MVALLVRLKLTLLRNSLRRNTWRTIGMIIAMVYALGAVVAIVEVFEPVEVVQVPLEGAFFAVDLQRVEGLVAAGIAGRLEQAERAVVEPAEE